MITKNTLSQLINRFERQRMYSISNILFLLHLDLFFSPKFVANCLNYNYCTFYEFQLKIVKNYLLFILRKLDAPVDFMPLAQWPLKSKLRHCNIVIANR